MGPASEGTALMATIVVMGEILVEIMGPQVGQTFLEPGLFDGPYPSGAPAIFADQAARLGVSTAMIGCVGPDAFGELNIERLRASGVDVSGIRACRRLHHRHRLRDLPRGRRPRLPLHHPDLGLGGARPRAARPEQFAGCRWFHLMGSSLLNTHIAQAVRRGVELARQAGGRISFDPNVRKELLALPEVAATIDEVLAHCDLLLPSEADVAHLYPGLSGEEAAARLIEAGREMVVLKMGARRQHAGDPGARR